MGFQVNDLVKTGGIPMHILKPLVENIDIPFLIETGTAGGGSIKAASKYFKKLWTIELVENRAEIDENYKKIKWLTGGTTDILPDLIQQLIDEKASSGKTDDEYLYALFWLDAHYSEPFQNTSEYKECYILEELEIISRYREDSLIIIDDARLFFGQPPYPLNPKEWCGIQDIFVLLKEKFPNHYSTIIDDYIISIPDRLREILDDQWRNNFHIRYPKESDKLKSDARNVFNAINNYLNS